MKKIFSILLVILFAYTALAQNKKAEEINIDIKNGEVIIEDNNIWANCAALYKTEITIEDKVIILTQTDTSVQKVRCMCYFDLTHTIRELPPGSYIVEIWRQELKKYNYPGDTLILIAKENIDVPPALQMPPVMLVTKQSECHGEVDVPNDYTRNIDEIQVNPMPVSSSMRLSFELKHEGDIKLYIYNMLGRKIKELSYGGFPSGDNTLYLNLNGLPTGIYLGKLLLPDKTIKSFKLIKNK